MTKKKKMPPPVAEAASTSKPPKRSPSWVVYGRVDPELEARVQAYRDSHEYPPDLTRVIERALKMLLESKGF